MLKIRVLGTGVIPRSSTIAPRLDPFLADLDTIRAIIGHGTLKAQVLNPNNGKYSDLTYENLMKYWKLWGNEKPKVLKSKVIPRTPPAPITKVDEPIVTPASKTISDDDLSKLAQETANEYLQKHEETVKSVSQPQPNNNSNNKKNWDKKDEKKDEKKEDKDKKDDGMITVIPSTDKK